MGGLTGCGRGDDDPEQALARMIEYYQEMEMILALLVARHGERHAGGCRYRLNEEDASALKRYLGTVEPVVIMTHQPQDAQYVIDVL